MILVDTSIWIDHLAHGDEQLQTLLNDGMVLTHPYVIGEIALGNLQKRTETIQVLELLPSVAVASPTEVMALLTAERLFGSGIGYVDLHLLASTRLEPSTLLWTRDKRLEQAAKRLNIAAFSLH
ncbi:type II toxin-antitoxin system VapC family toxin [Variovorax sp. RHLX14]|uniref:type II toxin-antitoxin system VapC family toxin n=1 Tax=Variovorax sp. RHLX14 TaxID=1259731 RepID=UPI003F44A2AE